MSETKDPVRWSDTTGMPEALVRGASAYEQAGPNEAQRAEMFARLEASLPASAAPTVVATPSIAMKLGALTALVLAAAGAWWWPAAREVPARVIVTAPAAQVSTPLPAPQIAPVELPPVAEVSDRTHEATPNAVQPARRAGRTPAPKAVSEASDPAAELALLSRARRVLPSSPARTLELTTEHAQRYPSGIFAEEREVLAIEALVRAGQPEQAKARAKAFTKAHPRSAHLERIGVILGGP